MYTLGDALRLREHVVRNWEAADRDPSLIEDGALNVVVVGGGPTGVETAGALAELYRNTLAKDYPHVPQDDARLILVEAGPTLFAMFKPNLQRYASKALEQRGVEIRTGESVTAVTPTRVRLKSGEEIPAHTLVWGAGLLASERVDGLGIELQHGRRVPVEADLSIAGRTEVFAVGDIAWITESDEVLPQLGSVALQSGEWAGANIARRVRGEDTKPFEYTDKGTMATIGRGAAVVQFRRGHTMKGKAASLAWGTVHLALLSTGEDRAKAVVEWTWAGFSHERAGRIAVSEPISTRGD
jgi:NADH dehydrogenase